MGGYFVVRMQLQSSMDDSLVERAQATAQLPVIIDAGTGNEDPRVGADLHGRPGRHRHGRRPGLLPLQGRRRPQARPGRARRRRRAPRTSACAPRGPSTATTASGWSRCRTATAWRWWSASRWTRRSSLLKRLGIVMALFGAAGAIAAAVAGWGVAANGLRPVRRLTGRVEHIARTEEPAADPGRGPRRDRPAVVRVQPDAGLAGGVPRPAAAAGRRRRSRAAHPAHLAAHQPGPAGPVGRVRREPCRPRRAPSCSTTYAPRSRR